ncbi:8700_t:CDS:2, partial [Gigaspora rosea]
AATFVTVAELKDLDEAITKARKAEAGEYYSKQTNEKSHQKKVEEELGNLSQKIEQIAPNYAASTSNRPKAPVDNDRCRSARDEGWVEDEVYALAEKYHQPYPVN